MIAAPARTRRAFAAKRIEEMPAHAPEEPHLHVSAFTRTPLATRRQVRRARNKTSRAARRVNRGAR